MSNENEAFEKWYSKTYPLMDNYTDYAALKDCWQGAIAYIQEQSEVVCGVSDIGDRYGYSDKIDAVLPAGTKLYTTPQRQQPLKRLSVEKVKELYGTSHLANRAFNAEFSTYFANAIMDAMQELNK